MPVAGGGFDQCYNAQAAVEAGSLLVVAADVVQSPNDKQQVEPMLDKIDALPDEFGEPETLLADNGYFSAANVTACEAAGIDPLIAMGRQSHHPSLDERFAAPPPAPEHPTPDARRVIAAPHNRYDSDERPCFRLPAPARLDRGTDALALCRQEDHLRLDRRS